MSHGQGRTVLFVSHNMISIKQLCSKAILMKNGITQEIDFTEIINIYEKLNKDEISIQPSIEEKEIELRNEKIINDYQHFEAKKIFATDQHSTLKTS